MDNIYSALHYAAKAKKSEEKAAEYLQQVSNKVTAVEGIIGDIGFAPLGIDEAQNKRRYLNGQVISQAQFESFTKKIKEAIALYPSLSATETNWQAEVTNSVLGQCGKFVIDDALGTIRLPKVVNVQGLADLSLMGSIKAESLPNITGITGGWVGGGISGDNGALYTVANGNQSWGGAINSGNKSVGLDASRSSSTYQDNAPVQQEAIQYPYFIQVATGVEETVDVTREIELNNPFSLLDYKWSEYELNNASWLISNGAFHSGTVYKAVYELLLKIKNGIETKAGVSVKLSTEEYSDTDFVINTADTTFRLPIKVKLASGNAVVGNGMTLGLTNGTVDSGLVVEAVSSSHYALTAGTSHYGQPIGSNFSTQAGVYGTMGLTTDPTKSGIETSSSGLKLYFYVGETIQDANVIAASQVLGSITDIYGELNNLSEKGLGYPTQEVIPQTWGTWVAPDNGFACANSKNSGDDHAYCFIYNTTTNMGAYGGAWNSGSMKYCSISVSKGDVVTCGGNKLSGQTTFFVKGK